MNGSKRNRRKRGGDTAGQMTLRPRFYRSDEPPSFLPPSPPPPDELMTEHANEIAQRNSANAMSKLRSLIAFLGTGQGERLLRQAHRETLQTKSRQYASLREEALLDVRKEEELISRKMPDLKRTSQVVGEQDNWLVFESISKKYIEAKGMESIFDSAKCRAESKLSRLVSLSESELLSTPLRESLRELFDFRSQSHIVETVVDVVGAFLKNPNLIRTKFLNFMIVGAAGTGKTTLAKVIAKCLASAGMFIEDRVICAGRAELVAEYEGQTVARTRHFLISNLDAGVIFVDEAYGITQWNDGKPEVYGSEAVTAMVEFMSKYKGLYCLIVAGYEKEMLRYFLSTNPGLARRFPFRFTLRDLTPVYLTHIFKRTLLTEQGLPLPSEGETIESETYFSEEAWRYLTMLIAYCTSGRIEIIPEEHDKATRQTYKNVHVFVPTYPHMHQLFMNQAGSMTNLAEECVTFLMSKIPFGDATRRPRASSSHMPTRLNAVAMKEVIRRRVMNSALSRSSFFLAELVFIERQISI